MANVYAGYRGLANVFGIGPVRFSDASISAKQTVEAPDLIGGDWDKDAYYYGKIEVGGSMSGPVTETFMGGGGTGLLQWGLTRTGTCGTLSSNDVTLYYYCGGGENNSRQFKNMYINTLGFSCSAGDAAQFTLDFMGTRAEPWAQVDPPDYTTFAYPVEKILTWDKVTVSIISGAGDTIGHSDSPTNPTNLDYSNFDFSISNNLTAVYSLGQGDLFPAAIVPGIRTITGSLSVYNTPDALGFDTWDEYIATGVSTINFNIGSIPISMKVRFFRIEPTSSVGPVISTLGYIGVSHQVGSPWEAP
jgi:hypothetical protein